MAPASRTGRAAISRDEDEFCAIKGDRKTRKPLVEKKRRARINESLHELRTLLADVETPSKMENAEVLELTVKRVENILQNRAKEADNVNREANERFAAGYIQCMHEVHTFISNCPGIDATVAADLLNHLLECMPLNDEESVQEILSDFMLDPSNGCNTWSSDALLSPEGRTGTNSANTSALSPSPSSSGTDDLSSDLDETDSEQSHISTDAEHQDSLGTATTVYSKSVWRPW